MRNVNRKNTMDITFRINYQTKWGESLALELDGRKHPMAWSEGGWWSVTVKDCEPASLKDYTYLVMEDGLVKRAEWERHSRCTVPQDACGQVANRKDRKEADMESRMGPGTRPDTDADGNSNIESSAGGLTITDSWLDCPIPGSPSIRKHQASEFDQPGFRGAGTAVPVFSLRTKDDFGIGEFNDLRPLVDWAAATGQCVVQLLPVNDTTRQGGWEDSYPYSPVSSFALHPLYIHLQDLGLKETASFKKVQAELNALPELDYPRVYKEKMSLVRKAFEASRGKDLESSSYQKFVQDNSFWLDEYASFCARRDSFEPDYYRWTQWHLDRQFSAVAAYARSKGVHFKGDLPIGVSGDSADAFHHPELFNLDSTAGAPPDFFSADGQNWGFPTYNWEEMAKDDFAWWKKRLRKMAEYFDAFRIDHILGFFRIWEIPRECHSGRMGHFNPALPYSKVEIDSLGLPLEGLFHEDPRHEGMYQPMISPASSELPQWQQERFGALYDDFFYHRHDAFWERNARRKLPELLGATGMLACGEDLGMVPDCVPGVMDDERILSLRMRGMGQSGPWSPLSVCATSSHDMETLRMQCQSDPSPDEVERMLYEYLASPSMLAIFPLQDWLALDGDLRDPDRSERINQPADPHHHWKFRIHLDLDELPGTEPFNHKITHLLASTSRNSAAAK